LPAPSSDKGYIFSVNIHWIDLLPTRSI
jgi:hypothetical protein